MMKTLKTSALMTALGAVLVCGAAAARADEDGRDAKLSSARDAGRAYLREEVNPFAEPSTNRGAPVIRGNGEIVMPGEDEPRRTSMTQQGGPQTGEEKVKKTYVYDKSAYGLFSDDVLPKRLFNNVNPRR